MEKEKLTWFFENDTDKTAGIETVKYENGNIAKRVKLSTGQYAVARELKGKDMKKVQQISKGNQEDYLPALMITSVHLEDEAGKKENITLEELDEMRGKDYNLIQTIAAEINF